VRAGLKKELGRMGERCGRSPRRVRVRGSVAVSEKTELTRRPHGAARESERAGERFTALTRQARDAERERVGVCEREKRRRQIGPTEYRERGSETARTWVVADRWDPLVRQSGRAREDWLGCARPAGLNLLFLFMEFSKCFSFYFLYGFQIKFKPNSNSN
jgi:hypothetical protein